MEPKITIKGQTMVIEIDLSAEGELSKSGKSRVISSTRGNKKIQTTAGEVVVGLNVYKQA